MAKIHYYDIFTDAPGVQPVVGVALSDLRQQRWSQEIGRRLYDLKMAVEAHLARIQDERSRLLTLYARTGDDGQKIEVKRWEDLADRQAFDSDWADFLSSEFEVAGIPFEAAKDRNLLGDTWAAPIWEFTPTPPKKEESAGA